LHFHHKLPKVETSSGRHSCLSIGSERAKTTGNAFARDMTRSKRQPQL
jgi:hypothetical protein